ncbi:hypothetical protein VT84_12110 [Gemmata sp. SH-PL17]|uniref:hypothetical protein n=1 Tax=Gemmata sp. SH-PL17 TaxID=1630693 RepID=UPI00078C14EA|nr:hypothetical protein [Gemmata sp. SH-PL17]AMV25133.1 hypothetical protein VT84_12110 [Gemmata sp. SH-PL17]
MSALLKGLATHNRGLCVVTTRYPVADLNHFLPVMTQQRDVTRLSTDAGVDLLSKLGVTGPRANREALVDDVRGHALTLNLLGSYLREAHGGSLLKRDLIKLEEADAEEQGGHAFRVMDAYVKWFENAGEEGCRAAAVLRLMGLFDRPAVAGGLDTLWSGELIVGLTEPLVGSSVPQRNKVLERLKSAKLLIVNRDTAGA